MTEPDQMQPNEDPGTRPPQSGHAAIDDAMLGLADLGSAPLSDHHDRLATAHEVLHEALERPDDPPDKAAPR